MGTVPHRLRPQPESQAAFFGGDTDNFTYPRYCLDVAFFRVYENGAPGETPHHLTIKPEGPDPDEVIFVAGHPGSCYPDATGTLRIAFGTVSGYPMNGTRAPHETTLYGLFDRAIGFGNAGEHAVPRRYWDRRATSPVRDAGPLTPPGRVGHTEMGRKPVSGWVVARSAR